MSKRDPHCRPGGTAVSIKAPDAKQVFVAGTFNNWSTTAHPMKRTTRDGHWVLDLDLTPGTYEYKFVVDGQWCCEPGCDKAFDGCPGCVPNEHGTMNRVLVVEELPTGATPTVGQRL
jgi:hypothetical protein